MAVDQALLEGEGTVLRLYRWERPSLSWGYFQAPDPSAIGRALSAGFDVVRRPSGGRTVLHYEEVTYALAVPGEMVPGSVAAAAAVIAEALVAGIRRLGAEVAVSARRRSDGHSAACYDAPAWHEVLAGGRKLVGSAQVRRGGRVLQHGSIPLRFPYRETAQILAPSEERAGEMEKILRRRAVGLEDILGRPVSVGEVQEALLQGFALSFGASFRRTALEFQEERRAGALVARYTFRKAVEGGEPG